MTVALEWWQAKHSKNSYWPFNHGPELMSFSTFEKKSIKIDLNRFFGVSFWQIFKTFYRERYSVWCPVKSHVNWITWKKQGTPYTWPKKWRSEQQKTVLIRLTHMKQESLPRQTHSGPQRGTSGLNNTQFQCLVEI